MLKVVLRCFACLMLFGVLSGVYAQNEASIVAPNVFVRGVQLGEGVRYTASFIKPNDNDTFRNVSIEITLPQGTTFASSIVPKGIEFHVVRRERDGRLTLLWQDSLVGEQDPSSVVGFITSQPLDAPLEFYIEWRNAQNEANIINFRELPSLSLANEAQGFIDAPANQWQPVGNTGVWVYDVAPVSVTILPNNFNPPAEYGNTWWCSLLSMEGVPEGQAVQVFVPLRRPLPPFSSLLLFKQAEDGSWVALGETAIVSADGQFALYQHTGGLIATGTDAEQQPLNPSVDIIPVIEAPVVEQPPQEQPAVQQPASGVTPILGDGSVRQLVPNATPNTALIGAGTPTSIASVSDGTSNTILIGELTPTPTLANDGTSNTIGDGLSNTIIISEVNAPASFEISDGSVRFISPSIVTPTLANDGTSNTILIGEITPTPTTPAVIVPPTFAPPPVNVSSPLIFGNVVVNPTNLGEVLAFGQGGVRVEVFVIEGGVFQCQVGGLLCASLNREAGTRIP